MLSSRPSRQTGPGRTPSLFDRFATLAGGGPILMMSARFGRSPVREAANRLHAQHRHLDLKLSWRLFAGLADWGERWPAEQDNFAAGLILGNYRVDSLSEASRINSLRGVGHVAQHNFDLPAFRDVPGRGSCAQVS